MKKIKTVTLPDIGEGVVEGEVIAWLKNLNDSLLQDEPVVVVMTDKATVELPAPCPGKLVKCYKKIGEIAFFNQPLYDIELEEEIDTETALEVNPLPDKEKEEKVFLEEKKEANIFKKPTGKVLAAPPIRKLAKEFDLDLSKIEGSGKEGRILHRDLSSKKSKVLHLLGDKEVTLTGISALMAKKMTESMQEIPQFSYFEQVDATRLVQLREKLKEEAKAHSISVTYMSIIIRALSLALEKYPEVNSSFDPLKNAMILHTSHNIGIAISSDLGLIVPVLKNVEKMNLKELFYSYDALIKRAKTHQLKPSDMKDSTITISNFGVLGGGGQFATPIINPPEAAILGIGRVHKAPFVRNAELEVREVLNLSWTFDHRLIDGDLAASFSHYFASFLLNPAQIL